MDLKQDQSLVGQIRNPAGSCTPCRAHSGIMSGPLVLFSPAPMALPFCSKYGLSLEVGPQCLWCSSTDILCFGISRVAAQASPSWHTVRKSAIAKQALASGCSLHFHRAFNDPITLVLCIPANLHHKDSDRFSAN